MNICTWCNSQNASKKLQYCLGCREALLENDFASPVSRECNICNDSDFSLDYDFFMCCKCHENRSREHINNQFTKVLPKNGENVEVCIWCSTPTTTPSLIWCPLHNVAGAALPREAFPEKRVYQHCTECEPRQEKKRRRARQQEEMRRDTQ